MVHCFEIKELELVETVRPTIPVKRATCRRLEGALGADDLRRVAEIPKRQLTSVSASSGSGSS
jgi:hypothetical protein